SGAPRPGALPVILCHGLTYNAQFWDLDPACSFARYLVGLGYDVWAVDLRGCGLSQKWAWSPETAPEAIFGGALRRPTRRRMCATARVSVGPRSGRWDFDPHIAYDAPALVPLVGRRTGAPSVTWIGHSMGGIVAIAHLARYPNPGIGRLVTVGSQVTMGQG